MHWSSALEEQGDIILQTFTIVFDGADTATPFERNITVDIEGVADTPPSRTGTYVGDEDVDYAIGEVIAPLLGGVLIDVSSSRYSFLKHDAV